MDYFDTAKKYRLKSLRKIRGYFILIIILALVAYIAWQFGQRGQFELKTNYMENIALIQNKLNVSNQELEKFKYEINLLNKIIEEKNIILKVDANNEIDEILNYVSKLLSNGVNISQVKSALRSLKIPANCLSEISKDLDVSTPIFTSPRKSINFFNRGLNVSAEGVAHKSFNKINPWFDKKKPINVNVKLLGYEKNYSFTLPYEILLPIDKKLIIINFKESEIRGSISVGITTCN